MKHLKKYNEDLESKPTQTLSELLGTMPEKKGYGVSETSNGVFTDFSKSDIESSYGRGNHIVDLQKERNNIYTVYLKEEGEEYGYEGGMLLMKDDKPYIFSSIPGDNYGAVIFNGSFIVTGHDGFHAFNIDNPTEYLSHTK